VTDRSWLDDVEVFYVWNTRRMPRPPGSRRVVIAHRNASVGESIGLLLKIKGYQCRCASDIGALEWCVQSCDPHAVLVETGLAGAGNPLVRRLATNAMGESRLMLALSDLWGLDEWQALRRAGFDGLVRRPCPAWRMADALDTYFRMR
jgi:DNA-binding response OmpR family regulator